MSELAGVGDWLTVFHCPAHALELNQIEGIWLELKRSLTNLAKPDITQHTVLSRPDSDLYSTGPS